MNKINDGGGKYRAYPEVIGPGYAHQTPIYRIPFEDRIVVNADKAPVCSI